MNSKVTRDYTYVVALLAIAFYLDVFFTKFIFVVVLSVSLGFVRYRKEAYLMWSVIEPRITGSINFTKRILEIAREEGFR